MKLTYYPGCSLHGTAREFDESTRAVCRLLGIELRELAGWVCCGATSGHSTSRDLGLAIAGYNLTLTEPGDDLLVPCAACFSRLRAAAVELSEESDAATRVIEALDGRWHGDVKVEHIAGMLASDEMLDTVRQRVRVALTGLRGVPYYGCLVARPPKVTGMAEFEDPRPLDLVMKSIGMEVADWSYKTDCCGGALTLSEREVGERLVNKLFGWALEAGAECIVTACPLCQSNLDTFQEPVEFENSGKKYSLPVFFVTELVALALGAPDTHRWWRRHMIDPAPLLKSKGVIAE